MTTNRELINSLVRTWQANPADLPGAVEALVGDKLNKADKEYVETAERLLGQPRTWWQVAENSRRRAELEFIEVYDPPGIDYRGLIELLASNRRAPSQMLVRLSKSPVIAVRRTVARNPSTPPEALTALAHERRSVTVRRVVAENQSTPPETLRQLAGDDDEEVRENVASNPQSPAEALAELASDSVEYVRRCVALNAKLSDVLARLADDRFPWVRFDVARNPATPSGLLVQLAGDPVRDVRWAAAENQSTPKKTLQTLAGDEDEVVRRKATNNPSIGPT